MPGTQNDFWRYPTLSPYEHLLILFDSINNDAAMFFQGLITVLTAPMGVNRSLVN